MALRIRNLPLFMGLLLAFGCSTPSVEPTKLNLKEAIRLQPGVASTDDVLNRLGKPDQVIAHDDPKLSTSPTNQLDLWVYLDGNSQLPRLLVSVDPKNQKLVAFTWNVSESDREHQLTEAQKILGNPKLQLKREALWAADSFEARSSLHTKDFGISISLDGRDRKKVSSISISEPLPTQRKVGSEFQDK